MKTTTILAIALLALGVAHGAGIEQGVEAIAKEPGLMLSAGKAARKLFDISAKGVKNAAAGMTSDSAAVAARSADRASVAKGNAMFQAGVVAQKGLAATKQGIREFSQGLSSAGTSSGGVAARSGGEVISSSAGSGIAGAAGPSGILYNAGAMTQKGATALKEHGANFLKGFKDGQ